MSSPSGRVGPWVHRFAPGRLRALLRSRGATVLAAAVLGRRVEVLDREGSIRSLREAVLRYRRAGALDQVEAREVWGAVPRLLAAYARDGQWSLVLLPPAFVNLFSEALLTWTRSPEAKLLIEQIFPALFDVLEGKPREAATRSTKPI